MTRTAVVFFILALLSILFGSYGVAGITIELGKILLMIFLSLSLLSFIGSLMTGKKDQMPKKN